MIFDSFGLTVLYIGVILLFVIQKYVSPAIYLKQALLLFANILIISFLIPPLTILTTVALALICYSIAAYFQKKHTNPPKNLRAWVGQEGFLLLGSLSLLIIWWVLLKYPGSKDFLRVWHFQGLADTLDVISTIGLSYIFFKLVHVLVDSYRGLLPELNPVTFLNYLFFFPTFLSGPIDRYQNFCHWTRKQSIRDQGLFLRAAFFRIFEGAVKKFIFVPLLVGYAKDFNQVHVSDIFWVNMAVSLIAYSFYIFFDFSGYSDLAIGVAMLLGFKVPENFESPYISRNIAEFWKRWHISLSSILREYIFLPMVRGVSKHFVKIPRLVGTIGGYLATFIICGLWHGNTLNFVLWGLWHGVGLSVHKLWCGIIKKAWLFNENSDPATNISPKEGIFKGIRLLNGKITRTTVTVLSVVMTFCYVTMGWFFFNYSIDQIRSVQEIGKLRMNAQPYYFYGSTYTWGVQLNYKPISPKDTINLDIRAKGENWISYASGIKVNNGLLDVYGIKQRDTGSSYNSLPPGQYELRLRYLNAGGNSVCRVILPVTIPDYTKHVNLNADDLEAKACRIANAGWGIQLKYHPPSHGTKVDIEYRPLGSKLWMPYQYQKPGRFRVAHIVEEDAKGNRGLKPGVYCIRIRYTDLKKGMFSDWTELSVRIPTGSEINGEANDEIS